MKVLLVKPYNVSDHIQPSLGLGYLATSIRTEHEVRILDCIKDGISREKLSAIVKEYKPDVLGLQCYTFDLGFVKDALHDAKLLNRKIVTVVGGAHPSAAPDATMELFGDTLDFLFVGEAETGLRKLLASLEKGEKDLKEIPGLVWRDDGRVRTNVRLFVEDLDSLGFPAWDLIRPQDYPESQHGAFFKQFPIAPIMITRGCPYPCTFCSGNIVSGRKIRRRSIENVLGEIRMLHDDFGIREFHVIDDNFTMDREYVKGLLRALAGLNLGMSWAVPNGVRMDTLDGELLGLMKETGLYLISLGIESGDDDVLRAMKKGITTARMRECIETIRRANIDIAGFFIIGFPGETESSIRKTIDFACSLPIVRANFFTYLPFPGSESYRQLEANGELGDVDWKRFYFTNAAYTPKGISRKRLKYLHRLAFARFYLRPRIMMYQLLSIKSFKHFFFLTRRFFRWIVGG